jgi:glycerol kinase
MDRRAVSECETAGRKISQKTIFEITGLNLDATHVGPRIRWLDNRDHHPETRKIYEEYYQLYRISYFSILPVFEQAARINS